jgi:hypothetical protein
MKSILSTIVVALMLSNSATAQLVNDPTLIAYYPFNGSGADISSNGFNATLVGPSTFTTDRLGNANSAFSFNGSSNYFLIENVNSTFKPTTFPVTVSAWLRVPSNFQGQFTFFKNDYAENIYSGIRGTIIPSGQVTIGLENGGPISTNTRRTKTGTTSIKDGQWHLITCVIRGFNNMDIYVDCTNNGGTYSGGATTLSYSNSNPGIVGAYDGVLGSGGFEYALGEIDELIFLGRELTLAEIQSQLYNSSVAITGNTEICPGTSTTLTAQGGTSYLWSTGSENASITITQPGTYSVVAQSSGSCAASAQVTVSLAQAPSLTVIANGDTSFCEGGSVDLSVNANSSFVWNDGGSQNPRTISQAGIYSVSSTNGCAATSNSVEVNVNENPAVPTINPSGSVNITQGGSVMLTASAASSYEWNPNGQTTQSISVNQAGSYSVRAYNAAGCSALSSATVVTVSPVVEPPISSGCSAVEVMDYNPAKRNDGTVLPAQRTISSRVLGAAQNSDATTSEASVNFASLGFGGSITVRMSGPIANGPGDDVKVFETTFGSMSGNCVRYPETVRAFASQDNCNWVYLGEGCQDATFDLGELDWAEYIRLVDVSPISSPYENQIADGYDVDGIECLNGYRENPISQDLGANYAMSVVAVNQGFRKNGTPVSPSRSVAANALGAPQNTNTVNFISLGFGGSIILKLGYVVFNKVGNDIQVVETSYGNPTCAAYGEKALVEVSLDGNFWTELGQLCLDGSVDFEVGGINAAQYVRITDRSAASAFSGAGDAYDVDGVVVLQPGCSASNPEAKIVDDVWTRDELAQVTVNQTITKDNIIVQIPSNEVKQSIITNVYSMTGQLVQSNSMNIPANQDISQIVDLSSLKNGIYLISVQGVEGMQNFKVVKQ